MICSSVNLNRFIRATFMIRFSKTGSFLARVLHPGLPWPKGAGDDEFFRISGRQNSFILKQIADLLSVANTCHKTGTSQATDFNRREKYDGLLPTVMKRWKQAG